MRNRAYELETYFKKELEKLDFQYENEQISNYEFSIYTKMVEEFIDSLERMDTYLSEQAHKQLTITAELISSATTERRAICILYLIAQAFRFTLQVMSWKPR